MIGHFPRDAALPVVAVGLPAVADSVLAADIPIVATATLLAVVLYGYRTERRLNEHGRILGSLKHALIDGAGATAARRSG